MTTTTLQRISAKNNFITPTAAIGIGYKYKTKRIANKDRPILTYKCLGVSKTVIQMEKPYLLDGTLSTNPMSWCNGRVIQENGKKYRIPSVTLHKIMTNVSYSVVSEIENLITIKVR